MRKIQLANGENYHVYNRGVDKRKLFLEKKDLERFFQSMGEFNSTEPIGSIYENTFAEKKLRGTPLVNFIAYCVNPNHFHFILRQIADRGIEKFMHRLGTGYTMYFNNKNKRSGSLFQGKFKAVHVNSNEYLLHLTAYVNLNYKVHRFGGSASKSSWNEYMSRKDSFCDKDIILNQFNDISEYKVFAESSLNSILEGKQRFQEMEAMLLEK